MKAFSKGITKEQFVRELKIHQEADNFIKGLYFNYEEGKGCAVGCSIETALRLKGIQGNYGMTTMHELYEEHYDIPEWLARVEDRLYEGLPKERSKKWPIEFGEAINEGSDLNKVKVPLIVFILESNIATQEELLKTATDEKLKNVIIEVIKVNNLTIDAQKSGAESAASAAESAAWSAARSAASAAWSAELAAESAESAVWSAVRSAAWSAARSVEPGACSAASAAESAAWSAARSAASAAESAAWSAAESAAYEKFADKLLELMRECK